MYKLIRRSTGKVNKTVNSREAAREYKRSNGFKHFIVRAADGAVVR